MDWRIYYDNGNTFSNEGGNPEQAPKRGVLIIVQRDAETGRSFWKEYDFYWWLESWVGGDLAGLLDYLSNCDKAIVLQGRTVSDKIYRDAVRRAINDPDFPSKSARYLREQISG